MAINKEFNGIELSFESKPAQDVRNEMKAAGFRWHSVKKLWYAKRTTERLALAEKLSGDASPAQVASTAVAAASEKKSKYGIKAGDVLTDSWGYEQTSV